MDAHWAVVFGQSDENGAFPTVCSLTYSILLRVSFPIQGSRECKVGFYMYISCSYKERNVVNKAKINLRRNVPVLWCDTRIPSILALIVRTRCQRNTRGRKNPRSHAFGRYGVETTPKTIKSCSFFLERITHFCDIFALHILFSSWKGTDRKRRHTNAAPPTPFHPFSDFYPLY